MPTKIVPLFHSNDTRDGNIAATFASGADAYYKDTVFDVYPMIHGGTRIYISGRQKYLGYHGSNGTAVMNWSGQGAGDSAVTAEGTVNSTMYQTDIQGGTHTSRGAITGLGQFISELKIAGTAYFVVISNASSGRTWYFPDGGALTEITDVDFPPKQTPARTITGNFVHLNDFSFVMCTDGSIWNSDYRSISSWTSTSYIETAGSPDNGVGILRYGELIAAFSKNTIEFFKNTQNPVGSPLSKVGQTINIGVVNQYAMVNFRDTCAFVSTVGQYENGIYILEGQAPKKISDQYVDYLLANKAYSNMRLHTIYNRQRQLLMLTFADGSTSEVVVYDPDVTKWCFWDFDSDLGIGGVPKQVASYWDSVAGVPRSVLTAVDSGVIINDGFITGFTIQTPKTNFGTDRRKFLKKLSVIGDQNPNMNNITVSWADNDFATFSTGRVIAPASDTKKSLYRCGTFRERAFRIAVAAPVTTPYLPTRLQALELDYEVGTT